MDGEPEDRGEPDEAPPGLLRLDEARARIEKGRGTNARNAQACLLLRIRSGAAALVAWEAAELRAIEAADLAAAALDFGASRVVLPPRRGAPAFLTIGPRGGPSITPPGPRDLLCFVEERAIDALAGSPAPADAQPPAPAPAPAEAPRIGRPPAHDWVEVRRQCRRRMYLYGLPEKSSILVAEIDALMRRTSVAPPEPRTIERFVAKLWPELREELEELTGPCDLAPVSNERRN